MIAVCDAESMWPAPVEHMVVTDGTTESARCYSMMLLL